MSFDPYAGEDSGEEWVARAPRQSVGQEDDDISQVRQSSADVTTTVGKQETTILCNSESESDQDVWKKRRPIRTQVKGTRAATPSTQMGKAVAGVASAVAALVLAGQTFNHQDVPLIGAQAVSQSGAKVPQQQTPKSTTTADASRCSGVLGSGSRESSAQPTMLPVSDAQVDNEKPEAAEPHTEREDQKTSRAKRGSAGTFAGRRPPKDPIKLALFEAKREAHWKAKEAAKEAKVRTPSLHQKDYWKHLSKSMKEGESMQQAVQTYCRKRPAAAEPSTPGGKKSKQAQQDGETPEKTHEAATSPQAVAATERNSSTSHPSAGK